MFTGLIGEVGKVASAQPGILGITSSIVIHNLELGSSISVNGVCLTVKSMNDNGFTVDIMPETRRRTNLGKLKIGDKVNLESPMVLGGKLDGHLVQGHVDGTGKITSIRPEGEATLIRFEAPRELMRYVVEKGFIAVDGISLTVTDRDSSSFGVSIVGFTDTHTTMGEKKVGGIVNLEVDIIAKYVEQLGQPKNSRITTEFLKENGFLV